MSLVNPGALPYEPIEAFPRWAEKSSLVASVLRWIAWSFFGVIALVFLWQPIGVGAQLGFATSVIVAMMLVRTFVRGPYMRWTFLALGSFVVLRYLYWRATQTLPDTDDLVDFTFGTLLAAAELYCAYVLAVSLVINADPVTRSDAPAVPDHDLPEVDVFVPELQRGRRDPGDDARRRAVDGLSGRQGDGLAARRRRHRPEMRRSRSGQGARSASRAAPRCSSSATDLGANYLTRARNEHAKAGNLNNGLAHSKAPIVVVFDADHVPFQSFLRETIGYFSPRSEAVPRADAARLPQSRSDRAQPADLRPHAVRERDVLRDHPARPRQVERLVLLRLGGGAAARGAGDDRRLLRHHHHRGLRDGVRAASRAAGPASMSTSR